MSNAPVDAFFGGLLGIAIFGAFWLSNQAMHAIVLPSPCALLGTILRVLHLLAVGVMLLPGLISQLLSMVMACTIIFVSTAIAGWSLRLTVFGTIFALDLLRFSHEQPVKESLLAFSSPALPLPRRPMGRLISNEGLAFVYRPWLIGPVRVARGWL